MLNALWEFAFNNLNRLQPSDYLVILLLAIFLSTGVFTVVKWIFGALVHAQQQLIETKDKTITEYKRNLRVVEQGRDRLEHETTRLAAQLDQMVAAYTEARTVAASMEANARQAHSNALVLVVLVIKLEIMLLSFRLYSSSRDLLFPYMGLEVAKRIPDAPGPLELLHEFDALKATFDAPANDLARFTSTLVNPEVLISRQLSLPESLQNFSSDICQPTLDNVTDLVRSFLNRVPRESP